MEIIVPAAGLSTRFPDMKPKYLLYDYKGEMMLSNALRSLMSEKHNIHIGILKEHNEKYDALEQINYEMPHINVVVIDKPTRGPADTVYQILQRIDVDSEEIFIKDCDSFFDHKETIGDNYVCVSNIQKHELLRKLSAKSFTIANENDIITNIVEKQVVSNTFCVGGYKFSSAKLFTTTFESININNEVFVSDIIARCINNGVVFTNKQVSNYVDVGTAKEWFEFNDRPVIFCDIDGTIIENQVRIGKNSYYDDPKPLKNNIERLLELQNNGAQFIFTTARPSIYYDITSYMISNLGFENFTLITGLQNSKRIIINDYNSANPYPRAEAINIKRNSDNLKDFL